MKNKSQKSFIRKSFFTGITILFLSNISVAQTTDDKSFKPNFESLSNYECPTWFRDAKFGIFLHWGVNSVPGFNGHYARYMYWQSEPENMERTGWNKNGADVYDYHVKTYGHPTKFGYKDFLPLWKADKFDANALAKLFKKSGAKYVVPMAVHHDNFDNWNSKHHKWNSVEKGPKIDIIGAWKKACNTHDLKFGVSSHFNQGHENVFFQGKADFTGPLAGVPYDSALPEYEDFYFKRSENREKIVPEFGEEFLKRHIDLIDSYKPDLLYFDGPLPYGENGMKVGAHFYNSTLKDGKVEGVLNLKRGFPEGAATLDMEKGQADKLIKLPWQTDTTINAGWFYLGDVKYESYADAEDLKKQKKLFFEDGTPAPPKLRMTASLIVDNLVDIVSKNGNLLLNVGQKPDGSIDEVFVTELEKIGKWLDVNGDAIYNTRPWKIFGEGPTQVENGNFKEPDQPFTSKDIRFTKKGNVLYATCLAIPTEDVKIKSLGKDAGLLNKKIKKISLIGHSKKIKWKQEKDFLSLGFPKNSKLKFAVIYKIKLAE